MEQNPQEMIGLVLWFTLPAHKHAQTHTHTYVHHAGCLCMRKLQSVFQPDSPSLGVVASVHVSTLAAAVSSL